MMRLRFILPLALAIFANAVHAEEFRVGEVLITNPHARPTVPHQPAGAAYLTIENKGNAADRLIGASAPVAKSVEIHTMSMEGNIMKMREVRDIELKPATRIAMQPGGGYHLMLLGLRQPLKAGERFMLTLTFEKAGKTEVPVSVDATEAKKEHGAPHSH